LAENGNKEEAIVIHRSSIGAIERIIAFLIERYKGAFPTWLAPVQIKILPISEKNNNYADKIRKLLSEQSIRIEFDSRNETLQAKIRDAQIEKIPYMLIVGNREEEDQTITIRSRDGKINKPFTLEEFISKIKAEIEGKTLN